MLEELKREEEVSKKEYLKKMRYVYQKCLCNIYRTNIRNIDLLQDRHYQIWYEKNINQEMSFQ